MTETRERLIKRIMILNNRVWEGRMDQKRIDAWLSNFYGLVTDVETERLHALFWLSQFMYYGSDEIRVLLKSLYRDLFFCPMVQQVKLRLEAPSKASLANAVAEELKATLFFGVGNPSDSGIHLLYYFRQENALAREQFLDVGQIFRRSTNGKLQLNKPDTRHYVFLDDMCGSGDTAVYYSENTVRELIELNNDAQISYFTLFASSDGLTRVKRETLFSHSSAAVHEFDPSYRALGKNARYFPSQYPDIIPEIARDVATTYGHVLDPNYATGYKDSQMLLGFHHNTPDNTLGIFWGNHINHQSGMPWSPAFKRYPKVYGDESV